MTSPYATVADGHRSPPNRAHVRVAGLDGLRGIAALGVFAFHVWLYRDGIPARAEEGDAGAAVLSSLRVFLVMFFVLSGFLLARDLRRWLAGGVRATVADYARRRAARVLPAYWLSLAGAVVLLWGGSRADGIRLPESEHLWAFFVLAQNYLPETVMSLNPVTWTLVVEVAFYALLPLLAVVLIALRRRSVTFAALLLLAATLGANLAAAELDWPLPARKTVLPFLGCFGLGMLAAEWRGRVPRGTAAAGAAGVVTWMWWGFHVDVAAEDPLIRIGQHMPAAAGFALLVLAASRRARLLSSRPLARMGVVSYGFFLWHLPLLLALNRFTELPWPATAALALAGALLLAEASWRYVEAPAIAAARRRRSHLQLAGRPDPARAPARP